MASSSVPDINSRSILECNICIDFPEQAVVSHCGHVFCKNCIYQWLEKQAFNWKEKTCPVCMAELNLDKLIQIYGLQSGNATRRPIKYPGEDENHVESEIEKCTFPKYCNNSCHEEETCDAMNSNYFGTFKRGVERYVCTFCKASFACTFQEFKVEHKEHLERFTEENKKHTIVRDGPKYDGPRIPVSGSVAVSSPDTSPSLQLTESDGQISIKLNRNNFPRGCKIEFVDEESALSEDTATVSTRSSSRTASGQQRSITITPVPERPLRPHEIKEIARAAVREYRQRQDRLLSTPDEPVCKLRRGN